MQISNPNVRGRGRKHVIGTSMSSKKQAAGRRNTLSQEDYSIFSPVLCPAVVCWVKDPNFAGQSVEDIVLPDQPKTKEVMSDRSLQGEIDFQDAVTDFQESDAPALLKETHTDISTHIPEFEQMHPHPLRLRSPSRFLEREHITKPPGNGFLTSGKTSPDLSGHLQSADQSVDSSSNASVLAAMKSPRCKFMIPSPSPDEYYARERASVANSPQHPSMWSPHRAPTDQSRLNVAPPSGTTSPTAPKSSFGWLTPTRTHMRAPDPRSPEFAKPPLPQRDLCLSPSHMLPPANESWSPPPEATKSTRSTMKLKRQAKLQQQQQQQLLQKGSTSPSDISIVSNASNVTVDKGEKSPSKGWKNLSRSIPPMFAGMKSETSRNIGKDLGNSFQGSKRRPVSSAPVATWSNGPAASAPVASWSPSGSGDGSIVTPESEKEPSAGRDAVGYSPELTRNESMNIKSTKSHGMFNFLGWGRKKSHGAKVNELFQTVEQAGTVKGTVKLDSNSFKVMDYTIKTLQFKLEQAKKNELATANEFKALQLAMDAAEGKCKQLQQRCQELETDLEQLQAETKVVELDYEIAKHRRENASNNGFKGGRSFTTLEVTPQLFQKAFEDSKLSIKKLASALCIHIREAGESATQVITSLLEQQKDARGWVSKMPRNVIILYFESFLNQVLFESFENVSFEPNGTSPVCDPDALKSSCCKAFQELRKQEWATIEKSLGKPGSTIVNHTFHRFFVIRMELILSQLTKVADKETSLSLLATFFNAFKSVWLLHHLAFAHEIPVTIFRVSMASDFDPRFMEQVTTFEEDVASRSKISVMVNPGFIVNRHTIKCQVFCSSKYQ